MELEKKWQNIFSVRALTRREPHEISHWTKTGFRVRKKKVAGEIGKLYRPGQRVLDLGSGPGQYAPFFSDPVLLDYSWEVLTKTPAFRDTLRVCADFASLPFRPGAFDGVLCIGLIQCRRLLKADLAGLHRVMKNGAWFLFETLNCEWNGLKDEGDAHTRKALGAFVENPGMDPCDFVHDGFVVYHADKLLAWFESAGFTVQGLHFICGGARAPSLLDGPLRRFGRFRHYIRRQSRSFVFFGRRN